MSVQFKIIAVEISKDVSIEKTKEFFAINNQLKFSECPQQFDKTVCHHQSVKKNKFINYIIVDCPNPENLDIKFWLTTESPKNRYNLIKAKPRGDVSKAGRKPKPKTETVDKKLCEKCDKSIEESHSHSDEFDKDLEELKKSEDL